MTNDEIRMRPFVIRASGLIRISGFVIRVYQSFPVQNVRSGVKVGKMEEVLPPQTMDGAGFEPTRVRQYTVFLENKVGRLQTLVRALEQTSSKIVAMSIHESADSALVRLICSDPDESRDT